MKSELKKYYDSLLAERARLQQMIDAEEGERFELSVETDAGDEADKSLVASLREFTISRVDLGRQTLRLVNEALERLSQEEYGHCLKCGAPISPKRLAVVPWARYCVKCQELKEKGLLEDESKEPVEGT
jgi:DnaK suppressor protein